MNESEFKAALASSKRQFFYTSFGVGVTAVMLAITVAWMLVRADMNELRSNLEEVKQLIQTNNCQCNLRPVRAEATGNTVMVAPDTNSIGQHAREILRKQGHIE